MNIKPKFLKHKDAQPHHVNSYGNDTVSKLYSRKKVITPISSESAIRSAMQSKGTRRSPVVLKVSSKNAKHLSSGTSYKVNANEKLVILSSGLDAKLDRKRKLMAFIAKVVLWSVILYVLVLSRIPEIIMIFSRQI